MISKANIEFQFLGKQSLVQYAMKIPVQRGLKTRSHDLLLEATLEGNDQNSEGQVHLLRMPMFVMRKVMNNKCKT